MRPLLLILMLALAGCAHPLQRFEFTRLCMGVQTRIIAYAPEKAGAETAAVAAFNRIEELDAALSDYRRASELNRLNAAAGGPATPVGPDLWFMLAESARLAEASQGSFDITTGPAVALWRESRRTGAERGGRLPDPDRLALARSLIDHRRIHLDPAARTARLDQPGMRLDLGGIAKGYAAEEASRVLAAHGAPRNLVALAGDIYAGDPPPGTRGWTIEVRTDNSLPPIGTLLLRNAAVSTSGGTEQFVLIDGLRYAHILDPRTGLGLTHQRAATVVSRRGHLADALATAVCILGPDHAPALLAAFPTAAAIVDDPSGRTTLDPGGLLVWEVAPSPPGR